MPKGMRSGDILSGIHEPQGYIQNLLDPGYGHVGVTNGRHAGVPVAGIQMRHTEKKNTLDPGYDLAGAPSIRLPARF
jgi:hypothetical protein